MNRTGRQASTKTCTSWQRYKKKCKAGNHWWMRRCWALRKTLFEKPQWVWLTMGSGAPRKTTVIQHGLFCVLCFILGRNVTLKCIRQGGDKTYVQVIMWRNWAFSGNELIADEHKECWCGKHMFCCQMSPCVRFYSVKKVSLFVPKMKKYILSAHSTKDSSSE